MARYRLIRPALVVAAVGLSLMGISFNAFAQSAPPEDHLTAPMPAAGTGAAGPAGESEATAQPHQPTSPPGPSSPTGAPAEGLTGPTTVIVSSSDGTVTIRWSGLPRDAEGVRIYRDGAALSTASGDPGSFVDTAPAPGATHSYAVVTYAGAVESTRSNLFTVTVASTTVVAPPAAAPPTAAPPPSTAATAPTPTASEPAPPPAVQPPQPAPPTTSAAAPPPTSAPAAPPTTAVPVVPVVPAAPGDEPENTVIGPRTTIADGPVHITQTNSVRQSGDNTVVNSNSVVLGS